MVPLFCCRFLYLLSFASYQRHFLLWDRALAVAVHVRFAFDGAKYAVQLDMLLHESKS